MKSDKYYEELAIGLAILDKEDDVISLLKKYKLWGGNHWRNYGDNENNFATIGNQQSKPESAFVEKIINSVDAVLMAECISRGIKPDSKDAPSTIQDALQKFFDIYGGTLSNIDATTRSQLAEDKINIVATGSKSNPCYSMIDAGEGQSPSQFKNTFLSIGRSNKLKIPFVQGKFNMGGTGVLQFCGKRNIQLVLSKRNPAVASIEGGSDDSNLWGFTVVRREDPADGRRSSVYTYLAPNDSILSFSAKSLPLLPGEYPEPYAEDLSYGTFIKLYEYQMQGLKTNILFDLYNRLSLLMPKIALPIRMSERRKGYSGHSFETTLSGLTVRLDEDKSSNLEPGFPDSADITVLGQKLKVSIFLFKKNRSIKYTKNEGIIFIINGQTHGDIPRTLFHHKKVGMGYLADSLLVIVDATHISGRAREDLFLNSRDRLREGELNSSIKREIEELLRDHAGLKEARARRRQDEIADKLSDSKPLAEVINKILKKSPVLSKLFIQGIKVPNPFKTNPAGDSNSFIGNRFPTIFKLETDFARNHPKHAELNRKFRVSYKTDVVNDYFDRDDIPGEFELSIDNQRVEGSRMSLWNGIANLTVSLPKTMEIGDTLKFCSKITDASRAMPFEEEFYVQIMPFTENNGKNSSRRKPPTGDGNKSKKPSYVDLPEVIEVRKEEWDKHDFNEESALKVIDSGEAGYDFFINMDNIYLLSEQKANNKLAPQMLGARYKYAHVLMGLALLRSNEKESGQDGDNENNAWGDSDILAIIGDVSKMVSPIMLPMIDTLGDLEIDAD